MMAAIQAKLNNKYVDNLNTFDSSAYGPIYHWNCCENCQQTKIPFLDDWLTQRSKGKPNN